MLSHIKSCFDDLIWFDLIWFKDNSLPSPFSVATSFVRSWLSVAPASVLPSIKRTFSASTKSIKSIHLQLSSLHTPILLIWSVLVDVDLGNLSGTRFATMTSVPTATHRHHHPCVVPGHGERLVLDVPTSSSTAPLPTSPSTTHQENTNLWSDRESFSLLEYKISPSLDWRHTLLSPPTKPVGIHRQAQAQNILLVIVLNSITLSQGKCTSRMKNQDIEWLRTGNSTFCYSPVYIADRGCQAFTLIC